MLVSSLTPLWLPVFPTNSSSWIDQGQGYRRKIRSSTNCGKAENETLLEKSRLIRTGLCGVVHASRMKLWNSTLRHHSACSAASYTPPPTPPYFNSTPPCSLPPSFGANLKNLPCQRYLIYQPIMENSVPPFQTGDFYSEAKQLETPCSCHPPAATSSLKRWRRRR
jgi:hypothetical protein